MNENPAGLSREPAFLRRGIEVAGGDAARPHVLHVVDNLAVGGLEQVLLALIERTRDRFDHSICCIRDLSVRRTRFAAAGATVTFVSKSERHDWSLAWRIARVCRTLQPHIVHTRNWGAIEGVPAARLARIPVVIHGEHGRDTADGSAPDRRRDGVRRLLFRFVDRVVVVSKHLERWLLDDVGVRAGKAAVILNGVDTDGFRPRPDRERLRRERGYTAADLLIGAVGRLRSVKDYRTLLTGFATVLYRYPEARLVIVGGGPEGESLTEQIHRHGLQHAARLVGHQDDVPEWLAAMDVFVQSSLMEGTSNAILEAMSVGLPVVATRVGGNPEVMREGVTGRLVGAGDVAALAEAICFYVRTPMARDSHGAAGRERVREHYPVARTVDAYTALYRDALQRRRGRGGDGAQRAAS